MKKELIGWWFKDLAGKKTPIHTFIVQILSKLWAVELIICILFYFVFTLCFTFSVRSCHTVLEIFFSPVGLFFLVILGWFSLFWLWVGFCRIFFFSDWFFFLYEEFDLDWDGSFGEGRKAATPLQISCSLVFALLT